VSKSPWALLGKGVIRLVLRRGRRSDRARAVTAQSTTYDRPPNVDRGMGSVLRNGTEMARDC
jgi:hypothetical protein